MDNQPNNQTPIQPNPTSSNPPVPPTKTPIIPPTTPPTTPPIIPPQTPNPTVPQNPVTEPPISTPPPETQPAPPRSEFQETQSSNEYHNEYKSVLDEYAATQKPTAPPVSENQPQPDITLADLGIAEKPPQNNIFKIIFILSVVIFISVISVIAFIYFKNQNNRTNSKSANSNSQNNSASQNPGTCFLNDKTYKVGESFHASDDCNICTCESQDNITCTDNRCSSEKPATSSAAPTSTSSTQKTTATPSAAPR